MANLTAISASSFLDSLGVNMHLDFNAFGYQNLGAVESTLNYLGLKNVRDSGQFSGDLNVWQQVAAATGVKFDDYLPEGGPGPMQGTYDLVSQFAQAGVLNAIEGGNEEDNPYAASQGNSLGYTAGFQQQVYALGQSLGLPVTNMSFGAGWTAANNWQGDYADVGDLSAFANYGNGHAYPNVGQTADSAIQQINGDAKLAAASRPVILTEMGWDNNSFGQGAVAQYVVQAALDGIKDGDARTYFYSLFDDASGAFGLMNADGSAKPAGTALHNLTSLLSDGGGFTPGSLSFTLDGAQGGDNTLLLQKSDGSDWLAVWDETAWTHPVTLNLPNAASQIEVYDPVTGTASIASAGNASSISLSLGNDPLLVEIIGSGTAPTPGSSGTGAAAGGGGGTTPTPTQSNGSAGTPNPVVTLPAAQSVAANAATPVGGVSVADPWAANHGGTMALNVLASGGTVAMNGNGSPLSGSGSGAIHVNGSLAQINADLATLSYASAGGGGSVTVDVWDQAGVEATQSLTMNVGGSAAAGGGNGNTGSSGPGTPSSNGPTVNFGPDTSTPVENANNVTVNVSGGDQMIFIGGSQDTLYATGNSDTVEAWAGNNTLSVNGSDNTIRYAGSGNVLSAVGGSNTLMDSGNSNTIVLPGAGQGYTTVYGNLMTNGDMFDLRGMLSGTGWDGSAATIGNYVQVAASGNDTVVGVAPNGGGGSSVATLMGTGPVSLGTLLAHAIT